MVNHVDIQLLLLSTRQIILQYMNSDETFDKITDMHFVDNQVSIFIEECKTVVSFSDITFEQTINYVHILRYIFTRIQQRTSNFTNKDFKRMHTLIINNNFFQSICN